MNTIYYFECRLLKNNLFVFFFHAELNGDHKADDENESAVNNQISVSNFDKKEQPNPPTASTEESTPKDSENNKNEVPEAINNDKEMDTDEDKPLARRRRSLIKVIQPTVSQNFFKKSAIFKEATVIAAINAKINILLNFFDVEEPTVL